MQKFGIAPDDMSGAVATFIAGSHAAYRNTDIEEADFKRLVEQIRNSLIASNEFTKGTAQQRRDIFEEFAIFGMMGATSQMMLQQYPDHPQAGKIRSNMQKAGEAYVRSFFKVDPKRIELGLEGVRIKN